MDHATENGSSRPLTDGEATLRRPPLQYSLRGLILLTTVSCPFIRHRALARHVRGGRRDGARRLDYRRHRGDRTDGRHSQGDRVKAQADIEVARILVYIANYRKPRAIAP